MGEKVISALRNALLGKDERGERFYTLFFLCWGETFFCPTSWVMKVKTPCIYPFSQAVNRCQNLMKIWNIFLYYSRHCFTNKKFQFCSSEKAVKIYVYVLLVKFRIGVMPAYICEVEHNFRISNLNLEKMLKFFPDALIKIHNQSARAQSPTTHLYLFECKLIWIKNKAIFGAHIWGSAPMGTG